MSTYDSKKLQRPHPHSYILPFTLIFVFDIFIFRHFYVSTFLLSTKVGITTICVFGAILHMMELHQCFETLNCEIFREEEKHVVSIICVVEPRSADEELFDKKHDLNELLLAQKHANTACS